MKKETQFTALNVDKEQTISLSFFCQWQSGAKEYFHTMELAVEKAKTMYVKPDHMSDENFKYWLTQKQTVGTEITITTPIYSTSAIL